MKNKSYILISEPDLEAFRGQLLRKLRAGIAGNFLVLNELFADLTADKLILEATRQIVAGQASLVVLVSRSGHGLQMIANKNPSVRAASLNSSEAVKEAVELNANMCEVSSQLQSVDEAANRILSFLEA